MRHFLRIAQSVLATLLNALKTGVAWWVIAGIVIWTFLAWPYGVSAFQCRQPNEQTLSQCLKPLAEKIRSDSNLATYATATVAAAIALQLSNRNRESKPPSDQPRATPKPEP